MRYRVPRWIGYASILIACTTSQARAECRSEMLAAGLHHLRIDGPREWDEYPEHPDAQRLDLSFDGQPNSQEYTLRLRQQDVKQLWHVRLNGVELGQLHRDENDMVVYYAIPSGTLNDANTLTIEQEDRRQAAIDDIRVGEISLSSCPLEQVFSEASVELVVSDASGSVPARITVRNESGALQMVQTTPSARLAVRPGTVYTATGRAAFTLPAGTYTIHAGRGFEYSLATTTLSVAAGDTIERSLAIRREVPTEGYIACDSHVHTLTHSGHGDATVQERMVTIAAEGIELAVATDHNTHIDHELFAREVGVRHFFTPVIGNEVTTPVGHFNVFPVPAGAEVPNHQLTDWEQIFAEIERSTAARVVILNHARDLHRGVRPFGPVHFNSAVANRLDGAPIGFNAMEVINSGATQTDPLQLFEDWMALLNRGKSITPIGSSDSHDVARHFVGQGRTYIRCDDEDPGNLDVDAAIESLRQGRVMVSYGLLAELEIDGHASGEVVHMDSETISVKVRVLGPHWVDADRVELFANGWKIRQQRFTTPPERRAGDQPQSSGVKWAGRWDVQRPPHDVHLVAIASGPGIDAPYWKTAKPYQPTTPTWQPRVIGCSGAIWLDVDGDGKGTSAHEYAQRIWDSTDRSLATVLEQLSRYDAAVATHAAELYLHTGGSVSSPEFRAALQHTSPSVRDGFQRYFDAWRDNLTAAP